MSSLVSKVFDKSMSHMLLVRKSDHTSIVRISPSEEISFAIWFFIIFNEMIIFLSTSNLDIDL